MHLQATGHLSHGKGSDGQAGDAREQIPWNACLWEKDLSEGQKYKDHDSNLNAAVNQQTAY